jgi:hypothetical protein
MQKQKSTTIAVLLALTILIFPVLVMAQPPGNPPNANVDANFHSVTINDGTKDNLNLASDGNISSPSGNVVVDDNFSIFDGVTEVFSFTPTGFTINGTGMLMNLPGFGGLQINNAGSGGLDINAAEGGLQVNATTGGIQVNATTGGITVTNNGGNSLSMSANGRIRTGDTAGQGGVWVNEAMTMLMGEYLGNIGLWNNGWHLLVDAGGDLKVDNSTLMVDASANRVGIGTTVPGSTLDVNGHIRANSFGSYYDVSTSIIIPSGGQTGVSAYCPAGYTPINCGYYKNPISSMHVYFLRSVDDYCTVSAKNDSPGLTSLTAYAKCFNPDL